VLPALLASVLALGVFWLIVYDAPVLAASIVVVETLLVLTLVAGHVYLSSRRADRRE
jgi:hypothetical protein